MLLIDRIHLKDVILGAVKSLIYECMPLLITQNRLRGHYGHNNHYSSCKSTDDIIIAFLSF